MERRKGAQFKKLQVDLWFDLDFDALNCFGCFFKVAPNHHLIPPSLSMAAALEDDIDFETLQAQLDKTWAYAHSVVDSWMKPGQATAAASSAMTDKEMNDLLRRPPRCVNASCIPPVYSVSKSE